MSRNFNGGDGDFLGISEGLPTAFPFTIAGWGKHSTTVTTGSGERSMFSSHDGTLSNFVNVRIYDSGTAGTLQANFKDAGGGTKTTTTSNTVTATGIWFHYFTAYADGDIQAILNGDLANDGTQTHSAVTISDHTETEIGNITSSSADGFHGLLAWFAIWDIRLTEEEGVHLASGVNPMRIARKSILACYPIWGTHSPEINIAGSDFQMTVNGTAPLDLEGPPVEPWYPGRRVFVLDPAPVAGALPIPVAMANYRRRHEMRV